ncbi:MAG: thermonuclease family protein [Pseudomonadota bacterium]
MIDARYRNSLPDRMPLVMRFRYTLTMVKREKPRRTISVSEYRWLVPYVVVLLIVPAVFVVLFSFVDIPEEPPNQYAEQLEDIRAQRGVGFPAAPGTHKVIRVVTGDTIDIRAPGSGVTRVRLACIDAPRKGQRYWLESRRFLAREIDGMFVTANPEVPVPGPRRSPPRVQLTVNDEDIGRRLLAKGFAWSGVADDCSDTYRALQREARSARMGLWQDLNPIAPWRWEAS